MLGGVNRLTTIMFTSEFASDRAMLKVGVPAILFLLILGTVGASRGSGFVNYYGGNFENALTHLREKAIEGNAFASYLVGQIYANGRVGAPNSELALEWYLKAADQGSIAAPFSYLNHQLVSMNRSLGFCADFREVVLLSESQKHLCVFIFVPISCQWCM